MNRVPAGIIVAPMLAITVVAQTQRQTTATSTSSAEALALYQAYPLQQTFKSKIATQIV